MPPLLKAEGGAHPGFSPPELWGQQVCTDPTHGHVPRHAPVAGAHRGSTGCESSSKNCQGLASKDLESTTGTKYLKGPFCKVSQGCLCKAEALAWLSWGRHLPPPKNALQSPRSCEPAAVPGGSPRHLLCLTAAAAATCSQAPGKSPATLFLPPSPAYQALQAPPGLPSNLSLPFFCSWLQRHRARGWPRRTPLPAPRAQGCEDTAQRRCGSSRQRCFCVGFNSPE